MESSKLQACPEMPNSYVEMSEMGAFWRYLPEKD